MRLHLHICWIALLAAGFGLAAAGVAADRATVPDAAAPLPERLADTGLYEPGSTTRVRPEHVAFSPQYPLWSDGADKRRWLSLPPGTAIDASDPDAWDFPRGTRLWKEFSHGGRRVETRMSERLPDGRWRFATYVWNEDGSDAVLAPEFGTTRAVAEAPGGRYTVPSRGDCLACHEGAASSVLGASALQLSHDRDPLAPHAEPQRPEHADLRALVERGLLVNLPEALLAAPPRIAAASPLERAALGYLHGNCGHCHNRGSAVDGGVPVELSLAYEVDASAQEVAALVQAMRAPARYRPRGWDAEPRLLVPGEVGSSVLAHRMRSRDPMAQMPPLGTAVADAEALALIEHWIEADLPRTDPALTQHRQGASQ